MWMSCAVTEDAPPLPALSHVVCVGGPDHEDGDVSQGHQEVLPSARLPVRATPSRLASTSLWDPWKRLGLGVVLQEDAVALEDHVRLAVDHQGALERLKAHRVAELAAVGRHLDPVVDVIGDTGERAVDDFRGAPLGDAFRDGFGVGAVGEGEALPARPAAHLRTQTCCLRCGKTYLISIPASSRVAGPTGVTRGLLVDVHEAGVRKPTKPRGKAID
ncbi:hypothetical protein EYF80_050809 [Liparis tanakae]|uniref:Uncharacterized protein n=1 Tax=Liparis tanakae TaxID=230148 RepID=A0A4Z2FCV6_9TELE|nr:hypothetical protein EYF80_050809 [Liparis tanakae]